MPITKSAIKKQRADKTKTKVNRAILTRVKTAEKSATSAPSALSIGKLFSAVDVAVKKHVLKLNTASRIKAGIVRATRGKMEKTPFAKAK
jgi:ribosomal protein S20